jgi:hypothetical protein
MKKYYVLLAGTILAATMQAHAQTKIGGTGAPDGSAMLEVTGGTGNNKGILPPRLTTAQRDAINLPAKALMIYNTTTNQLQVNTGTPAAPIWSVATQANAWNTVGNAGTNPATNFIGTTDNQSLVMRTNAVERVRVDNIGRVGIGDDAPRAPLSFASTTGSKIRLWDDGTDTATYGFGIGAAALNYHIDNNPAAAHRFLAGGSNGDGTELMRIESTGNVGVATGNPQQTLHVQGTARITGNSGTPTAITGRNAAGDIGNVSVGTGLNLTGGVLSATPATPGWALAGNTGSNPNINYIGTADGQPLIIRTDATERMRVQSTGNIGIATNFPQQTLHVEGTARVTGSAGTSTAIMGRDGFGNIGNVSVGTGLNLAGGVLSTPPGWNLAGNTGSDPNINYIGTADGQPLIIRTNATERMRMKSTGEIGIGTNNPQQILHVQGVVRITGSNGTAANIVGRDGFGDISNITLGSNLSLSGGVLNATAPASGWGLTGNTGTDPNINYIGTADVQPLIFRTNATERMRMENTGNLGINTNNPQRTLHVQGGVRIAGSVGTPTAIMGRDGAGDIGNLTLGTGLTLTGGVLSASPATSGWGLTGNAGTNPASNYIGTSDAQPLVLRTNAVEHMRITNGGNVGINNGSPLSPLSFASAIEPKISFWDNGSATDHIGIGVSAAQLNYHVTPGSTHAFYAGGKNGDGTELMRIQSNGNVGIGTNAPTVKLDIDSGDVALTPTHKIIWGGPADERIFTYRDIGYPGANLFLESRENIGFIIDRNNTASASNTVGFIWATNTSWLDGIPQELMRLTDAGNLGLGIAAPAYRMDVAGDINASANVRAGGVVLTSDARLKRNISNTQQGLSTIMKLNPVEYDKKNSIKDSVYNRHEIGFIAQEVAKVLPSLVTEGKDADKTLAVSYTELIPVLTKAIQEQQAKIESQDQKINTLVAENNELKDSKAVTAQLMERVKQMEQMMGIKEIEGTSKVAGK